MAYDYVDSLNRGDGQNRFRYQGFAERVAAIDVDISAHRQAVHEGKALPSTVRRPVFEGKQPIMGLRVACMALIPSFLASAGQGASGCALVTVFDAPPPHPAGRGRNVFPR